MKFKHFGLILLILFFTDTLYGARYFSMDRKGNRYFQCNRSYGKVKVKKVSSGSYRVISIPFSGVVRASSAENAAEKACGEDSINDSYQKSPTSGRESGSCD